MDTQRIRNMASPEQIRAWYCDPRPRALFPQYHLGAHQRNALYQRFEDADYQIIREQQAKKDGVRDGIVFNSNLRGPHGVSTREQWFKQCSMKRMLIAALPEDRAKYITEHRRIIQAIRLSRFINSQYTAGISKHPFYVEPNSNFVSFEDLTKAEKHGVVFNRLNMQLPLLTYLRVTRRLQKAGRMTSFWSSNYDDDCADEVVNVEFAFVDAEQLQLLTEELVWLKMRY